MENSIEPIAVRLSLNSAPKYRDGAQELLEGSAAEWWNEIEEISSQGTSLDRFFSGTNLEKLNSLIEKAKEKQDGNVSYQFFQFFAINTTTEGSREKIVSFLGDLPPSFLPVVENFHPTLGIDRSITTESLTDNLDAAGYQHFENGALGVDHAHGIAGGRGEFVRIADIEFAWKTDHVGFGGKAFKMLRIPGSGSFTPSEFLHGINSLGVLAADLNSECCTGHHRKGIVPESETGLSSLAPISEDSVQEAFLNAIEFLEEESGSVLAIPMQTELKRPYVAIDWIFDLVKVATDNDIVVVAAAGNGAKNISDVPEGSGAILVGACSPDVDPTTRRPHGKSNFGPNVACHAFGSEVATLGLGPLSMGIFPDDCGVYSHTSSATIQVAGVAAACQSIRKERGDDVLTPQEMAEALSLNGSPALSDYTGSHGTFVPGAMIGTMPDLSVIFP